MKERLLGIAQKERRYDLPLNKETGIDFLSVLIALMTFLAVMSLAGSFVLAGMAERWSSGLENKITIEIPAEAPGGTLRTAIEMKALQDKTAIYLQNQSFVKSAKILEASDIQTLLQPWLGRDAVIENLPLPGLISVELKELKPEDLKKLGSGLQSIAPDIIADTHESWLNDLLRLTGTLQFITFIITAIIAFTTVMAVAGGVRSRIAIHRADVELLHLMGAGDEYITGQFQRFTLMLALKGGGIGLAAGAFIIMIIKAFSIGSESSLLPTFSLSVTQSIIILLAPMFAGAIAAVTARFTVLRALQEMP